MARGTGSRGLYRNALSYFGFLIMLAGAGLVVFFMALHFALKSPSPYLGILTFMVFPAVMGCGALIVLFGMRRESLRRRRAGSDEALPYPTLDLNDPAQRKRFALGLVGGTLLLMIFAFSGYNAFLFTESVTFCGRICHTVMEPEYTAYQHSPHAKVSCVECHVGHGAEWYVKSKLSGLYQVYSVTFGLYERPIPVPIRNLRPARETCEECHWPQKFYGAQLLQVPHFRYDEANTPEQISLLLKTGGGSPLLQENAGIHWHMILGNQITFAATDPQLQEIVWFESRSREGKVTEYFRTDPPTDPATLATLPRHAMDCMDCHNRPTHIYYPPETAVDGAMRGGTISRSLPWIKKVAVDALVQDYRDREDAHRGISEALRTFYAKDYPEVAKDRSVEVEGAIRALCAIYSQNVFPKMRVNWTTYASNIGHRNWPGCFRCHGGKHATREGKVLPTDCSICHTMPQRGPLMPLGAEAPASALPWHPMPLMGKHASLLCSRCHAAGFRPTMDCAGCHKLDPMAPMMSDCSTCHAEPGVKLPVAACAPCHAGLGGLHRKDAHRSADCSDCHRPHGWKVAARDACYACHDDRKEHNAPNLCWECHEFR